MTVEPTGPTEDRPPVGQPLVTSRHARPAAGRAPDGAPGRRAGDPPADEVAPEPPPVRHQLRGRTVLVTGASSELGAAFCEAFAGAGARVLLVDPELEALRARAADLPADRAMVLRCDLGSAGEVRAVGDFLDRADVQLDAVVHAARVVGDGPALGAPIEDLDEHYLIEVRGPTLLMQAIGGRLGPGARVVFPDGPEVAGAGMDTGTQQAVARAARRQLVARLREELAECGAVVVAAGWTDDSGTDGVAAGVVRLVLDGVDADVLDVTLQVRGPHGAETTRR
jgi:NAD(P)-dependent dehydrogenase (short-subunit alcohol dehydrogenase family)